MTPSRGPNGMWQLILFRSRTLTREPATLFWVFVFPLLISVALGAAFRNRELARLGAAVVAGDGADALVAGLDQVEGLRAIKLERGDAEDQLRRGKVSVVVISGAKPELITDPTQPDGRTARLLVADAMERLGGRVDRLQITRTQRTAPGSRYIDFLIPGLLGLGLMMSGIWAIGYSLVQMRTGKLLKRLMATPMARGEFLVSFIATRAALALLEILFFVLFARVLFDVRVFGSAISLVLFGLLGSLTFAGLGVLVASRAENTETANGLMNLVTMPLMALSGVFFASTNFPPVVQPLLKLLPLTALNDGLRAIMIDGASIGSLTNELGVLAVWGVGSFVIALRIFRWQ